MIISLAAPRVFVAAGTIFNVKHKHWCGVPA